MGESPDEEGIYRELRKINPDLAESFRREMNLFVWRSDLRKEPFTRSRITKSLTRETGIPKSLAEKIAREVEERVRDTNLTFITSSLIRELALIKLIEYGMEEAYRKYARLGIPVYDLLSMARKKEALEERVARKILTQYSILYLLPKPLLEAIYEGYAEVKGISDPFVPFAQTYFTRVTDVERWFQGLAYYLIGRPYVDIPSIYVPPSLEEHHLEVLRAISRGAGAILWSTEELDGVKVSEIPVYSFGRVPDRRVLDLVVIDVERVFISSPAPEALKTLEELASALEGYQERKRELARSGNIYVRLEGMDRVERRGEVEEFFSRFRLLKPSE